MIKVIIKKVFRIQTPEDTYDMEDKVKLHLKDVMKI